MKKNMKKCGLIIMGDLPRWKNNMMKCDLIIMGDLPGWKKYEERSYYDGRPTQMEKM